MENNYYDYEEYEIYEDEDDSEWPEPDVCSTCGYEDYWCDLCGFHGHTCPPAEEN